VEDAAGARMLMRPEEVAAFTTLNVCSFQQCQRFVFPHSLAVLGRALRETYDDVDVVDGCLVVCDCVRVSLNDQVLCITWDASPLADLVADSISLSALELSKTPPAMQALITQEDPSAKEARLFKVLCTFLHHEFGRLTVDEAAQKATFEVDGTKVEVDFPARTVSCDQDALKARVRTCLRRCETALRPLAPF